VSASDLYRVCARHYEQDYAACGRTYDVQFYVDVAVECGGPVLEMGCGTGRVLIPTARAGLSVHGVDASREMLEVLKAKLQNEPAEVQAKVTLTQGDIRDVRVPGTYQLVTAPFRVLQHLLERHDQRAWLRNVARHLAPGGRLCFDVFQPDYSRVATSSEVVELDRKDAASGERVRRVSRTVPHPDLQQVEIHWRWIAQSQEQEREENVSWRMRWFTRAELENLLELEGFEVVNFWGSFQRQPFGPESHEQVVMAALRTASGAR
jgi:SAM-dependent methyltransferase